MSNTHFVHTSLRSMHQYIILTLVICVIFVALVSRSSPGGQRSFEASQLPIKEKVAPPEIKASALPPRDDAMSANPKYAVLSSPFYTPGEHTPVPSQVQFFSSSSAYSPLPKFNPPQEKIGILVPTDPTLPGILNLYRQPIAPAQDLYRYTVQTKDGFLIQLDYTGYLDSGDTVGMIPGLPNIPKWTVKNYANTAYTLI